MDGPVAEVQLRVGVDDVQTRYAVGHADRIKGLAGENYVGVEKVISYADHIAADRNGSRDVLFRFLSDGSKAQAKQGRDYED